MDLKFDELKASGVGKFIRDLKNDVNIVKNVREMASAMFEHWKNKMNPTAKPTTPTAMKSKPFAKYLTFPNSF